MENCNRFGLTQDTPVYFPPCDVSEEIQSLKLGKALIVFQIDISGIFQEDLLCI
jgi:hypothetical protein